MALDVARWVSLLPLAKEETGDGIVLRGCIAHSENDKIDVFAGELRLSFRREDILKIEFGEPEDDSSPFQLRTACVLIRENSPILDIRFSNLCERLPSQKRPFALAVRPSAYRLGGTDRFRDLEREFLAKHGLIDA